MERSQLGTNNRKWCSRGFNCHPGIAVADSWKKGKEGKTGGRSGKEWGFRGKMVKREEGSSSIINCNWNRRNVSGPPYQKETIRISDVLMRIYEGIMIMLCNGAVLFTIDGNTLTSNCFDEDIWKWCESIELLKRAFFYFKTTGKGCIVEKSWIIGI